MVDTADIAGLPVDLRRLVYRAWLLGDEAAAHEALARSDTEGDVCLVIRCTPGRHATTLRIIRPNTRRFDWVVQYRDPSGGWENWTFCDDQQAARVASQTWWPSPRFGQHDRTEYKIVSRMLGVVAVRRVEPAGDKALVRAAVLELLRA